MQGSYAALALWDTRKVFSSTGNSALNIHPLDTMCAKD